MTDLLVRGARQHNLSNIDVVIPRDRLVVITGPSGSGKSSLAFDTIYAEGQRRYVESLSAYARQFLDRLPKPDVDAIEGLSPAISIEQKPPSRNPRSTVGTVTEIHDYLRLLFARVGQPHCPRCGKAITSFTVQQIVDRTLEAPEGARFGVLAPLVRDREGPLDEELARLRKDGYVRVRLDGKVHDLGDEIRVSAKKRHTLEVYVDRLAIKTGVRQRLTEAVELSLGLSGGLVVIAPAEGEEALYSDRFACLDCGIRLPDLEPRLFSFNNPAGACPACNGLGSELRFLVETVVPDATLSLRDGAIAPWGTPGGAYHRQRIRELEALSAVNLERPFEALPQSERDLVLHGRKGDGEPYEGVLPSLARRYAEYARKSREEGEAEEETFEALEEELGRFAREVPCGACGGDRLRPEALAVTVAGANIATLSRLPVREVVARFERIDLGSRNEKVAAPILRDVKSRLGFLVDVGLDYLSLDRTASTLSGGEAERIRLATQIGAGLVGVLYVLDEPSIGLHPRDNARLLATLRRLSDRGNTVLVVEHDEDTIRAADHVIDLGPGAGRHGGRVMATGTPEEIAAHAESPTGAYLSGRRRIEIPKKRRRGRGELVVRNASLHNLKNVDLAIPLGTLTCVTGVSGSGKSSLIMETLLPAVRASLSRRPLSEVRLEGIDAIDKVVEIDQSPIGRTPRSNPATYVDLLGPIRELFASLPEARARGYKSGRFSFNVKGGRCEACQGQGLVRIEMHFLPDVYVECETCRGSRFNRETLEVRYRGSSIADVLAMSVDDALAFFEAVPKVRERLEALRVVGLGYVELGRSGNTLSGGEAQRVKLARELARRATGRTLYVLDEPTTGLHFVDVEALVRVLVELVELGNTVVVIEHNLDVMKVADHLVDLGPEGGEGGGEIVAAGTPESVAAVERSHTGRFLRTALDRRSRASIR